MFMFEILRDITLQDIIVVVLGGIQSSNEYNILIRKAKVT